MFLESSLPIRKPHPRCLLAPESPGLARPLWLRESGKGRAGSCFLGMAAAAGPHFLRLAYSAFLGEPFLFNVSRANPSIAKSEKITCWCVNQDVTNNPVCLIIAAWVLCAGKGVAVAVVLMGVQDARASAQRRVDETLRKVGCLEPCG